MTVDQRIGDEERSFFRIQDMHRTEMIESRLNPYDLFGYFDRIGIFGIQSGDEGGGNWFYADQYRLSKSSDTTMSPSFRMPGNLDLTWETTTNRIDQKTAAKYP